MLEADIIYTGIKRSLTLKIILDQESTALSHDLALDDSRDYRIAREMALTEEFIVLDAI